jgi:hypothetical protein
MRTDNHTAAVDHHATAVPEPRPAPAVALRASAPAAAAPPRTAVLQRALTRRFRLPGHTDPTPGQRRLVAVSAWAGTLGFGGAVIALRLLVNLFQADGGWYRPTVTAIGTVGLLATVGAFASIHRRRLPWMLLTTATVALVAAYLVTAAA